MNGACSAEIKPKQLESTEDTQDLSIKEDAMDRRGLVLSGGEPYVQRCESGRSPCPAPVPGH